MLNDNRFNTMQTEMAFLTKEEKQKPGYGRSSKL